MKRFFFIIPILIFSCSENDAYEEGMHWDYSITCQEGFKYKTLGNNQGTIPLLNSDGTRVKCGKNRY